MNESHLPVSEQSLLFRLRKRAEIRRQIQGRKSVEEGKPDRIADLLEEAADEIERLNGISRDLMIKHHPILDTEKIIKHYEEEDNVPITYICTTDLRVSDRPVDIFFRESPHPEFGNRYFGLYAYNGDLMICNADNVEELEFGVVENDAGQLEYSQSHHDYKSFNNGNMIDGGRAYIRTSGCTAVYCVRDGEMVDSKIPGV